MKEYEVVQINEFYPCSKVELGSELYYICELGKYLHICERTLSLSGVILSRVLRKSRFWEYLRLAVSRGWIVDADCPPMEMLVTPQNPIALDGVVNRVYSESYYEEPIEITQKRAEDKNFNMCEPMHYQILMAVHEGDTWEWRRDIQVKPNKDDEQADADNAKKKSKKNRQSESDKLAFAAGTLHTIAFGGTQNLSQCWLSLIAYVAVNRFLTRKFQFFKLILEHGHLHSEHAVSDLELLMKRTNALDGWCTVEYHTIDQKRLNNFGYEAWLHMGREMGYDYREYDPSEKYEQAVAHMNLEVGDVVGVYTRNTRQNNNKTKGVTNFHFAIVSGISKDGIGLHFVQSQKTRYGYQKEWDEASQEVRDMFKGRNRRLRFNVDMKYYKWADIGVQWCLKDEADFIELLQNEDMTELLVHNGVEPVVLQLSEVDYIYWILRDFNAKFNEPKFRKLYYRDGELPLYQRIMGIDTEFTEV